MIQSLHRACQGSASRIRNVFYRWLGVNIRDYCWLRNIEIPRQWSDITLHGCALDRGVTLICSGSSSHDKIEIGRGTYINRFTLIDAHQSIKIGEDVMIGPHCYITDGNHGFRAGATVKSQSMESTPVAIGDGVWIGAQVTILAGVRIGSHAVIGAGSIVTKDIESNAIAFGSPAVTKRIRPTVSST